MKYLSITKQYPWLVFATILLSVACKSIKHYANGVGDKMMPEKIYYADFSRQNIKKEPSVFNWYDTTYRYYHPDTMKLAALKEISGHLSFRVFGGSWCGDTKRLLPKFYKVTDVLGIPDSLIKLSGVDRQKRSGDETAERYLVNKIPVFILYYDNVEAGRIIEKVNNSIEADMLAIFTNYSKTKK